MQIAENRYIAVCLVNIYAATAYFPLVFLYIHDTMCVCVRKKYTIDQTKISVIRNSVLIC